MRPILTAQLAEPPVQQDEVHRLIRPDFHPVIRKRMWKLSAKSPNQIKRQINCDKFDMRKRVEQRNAVGFGPAFASFGHLAGRGQSGMCGPRWRIGHFHIKLM